MMIDEYPGLYTIIPLYCVSLFHGLICTFYTITRGGAGWDGAELIGMQLLSQLKCICCRMPFLFIDPASFIIGSRDKNLEDLMFSN